MLTEWFTFEFKIEFKAKFNDKFKDKVQAKLIDEHLTRNNKSFPYYLFNLRCEELKNAAIAEVLPFISTYLEKAQRGTISTKNLQWARDVVETALGTVGIAATSERWSNKSLL